MDYVTIRMRDYTCSMFEVDKTEDRCIKCFRRGRLPDGKGNCLVRVPTSSNVLKWVSENTSEESKDYLYYINAESIPNMRATLLDKSTVISSIIQGEDISTFLAGLLLAINAAKEVNQRVTIRFSD